MTSQPENRPVYERQISVKDQDIDDLNHVNNVVYLQWVQDTAGDHWHNLAPENYQKDFRWVVLRHEIEYYKAAVRGDQLRACTWVEGMEGVKSLRRVDIFKGDQLLASALTTWVMIKATNGRPARVSQELADIFLKMKS